MKFFSINSSICLCQITFLSENYNLLEMNYCIYCVIKRDINIRILDRIKSILFHVLNLLQSSEHYKKYWSVPPSAFRNPVQRQLALQHPRDTGSIHTCQTKAGKPSSTYWRNSLTVLDRKLLYQLPLKGTVLSHPLAAAASFTPAVKLTSPRWATSVWKGDGSVLMAALGY